MTIVQVSYNYWDVYYIFPMVRNNTISYVLCTQLQTFDFSAPFAKEMDEISTVASPVDSTESQFTAFHYTVEDHNSCCQIEGINGQRLEKTSHSAAALILRTRTMC